VGRLTAGYPADPQMRVSHETIYLSLFVQARGALRKELARCLRSGRARRRLSVHNGQGQLRGTACISWRPAGASDRARGRRPGVRHQIQHHRHPGRAHEPVRGARAPAWRAYRRYRASAPADAITGLPAQLRRSLTWDQGKKIAEHARFSVATGVPAYFCDPHSPRQRGSNQNTGGRLRQYFPRSTDFRALTQSDLDNVAAELNDRPGKHPDGSHHVRHCMRRCDDRLRPRG
jgi:IS30 family transposase